MDVFQREVDIAVAGRLLGGTLTVPQQAGGLVIFAPGSGSNRFSPRHSAVARVLQRTGMATLLMDLLTADEEAAERMTLHPRSNIELLAGRLIAALGWVGRRPEVSGLPVGMFGSSSGAAAALVAAAEAPNDVFAVVSRGGRPDLASDALPRVQAPTLLIVGGRDEGVIELNEAALARLHCEKELRLVPRATHLFEEPGTIEEVARLAAEWFSTYLRGAAGREVPGWVDPGTGPA
jgi:putative phosphoribosyl transferase